MIGSWLFPQLGGGLVWPVVALGSLLANVRGLAAVRVPQPPLPPDEPQQTPVLTDTPTA